MNVHGNFLIQGSIRLRLWLSTREDRGLSEEEDMWNEIRQQESIYSIFLEHQLKQHVSQTSVLSTGKNSSAIQGFSGGGFLPQ